MAIIEYPVALVLKGWHYLFTQTFGVSAGLAWILAVIFLVLTVRGLLTPLTVRQIRSARNLANLRPKLHALQEKYEGKKDAESQKELRKARTQLQAQGGYRMRDGCVPSLIQIPVFIGLYRMLLRVARPNGVVDPNNLEGFGPLSDDDVSTFMHSRLFDVPLISYVQMPAQSLANLGTDKSSVLRVALVLVAAASVLTAVNFIFTIRRFIRTRDYASKSSGVILKFFKILLPLVVVFPIALGLFGPLPVVVFVYWVTNNLCTLTINQSVHASAEVTHPYTREFFEHNARQKELAEQREVEKKAAKRQSRRRGRHRR